MMDGGNFDRLDFQTYHKGYAYAHATACGSLHKDPVDSKITQNSHNKLCIHLTGHAGAIIGFMTSKQKPSDLCAPKKSTSTNKSLPFTDEV